MQQQKNSIFLKHQRHQRQVFLWGASWTPRSWKFCNPQLTTTIKAAQQKTGKKKPKLELVRHEYQMIGSKFTYKPTALTYLSVFSFLKVLYRYCGFELELQTVQKSLPRQQLHFSKPLLVDGFNLFEKY